MEKDVINILIVDDEKYEGILMEKSVAWESEGFHIMGNVQCAEDALALMEKQTPDIVYTDINMPRIDGLELSRRIRETYPAVHIVIVTGYREFEYAREAIHIGVEEFLLKPIQSDELLAAAVKLREQILKEREQQSKDVEIYPVLCRNCFEGSSPGILNLRKLRKSFLNIRSGCGKTKESGELCSSWIWKITIFC